MIRKLGWVNGVISQLVLFLLLVFSGAFTDLLPRGPLLQKLAVLSLFVPFLFVRRKLISIKALNLIWLYLGYICLAGLSGMMYFSSLKFGLASVQSSVLTLLFYLWASGFQLKPGHFGILKRLAYIIIIFQIIFSFIKYSIRGINEGFLIGTMSQTAGALGFMFPAVAIPLLVFLQNQKNKNIIYILVILMVVFSIINEKRAGVYLLPIIIISSYLYINNLVRGSWFTSKKVKTMAAVGVIAVGGGLVGLAFQPTLEKKEARPEGGTIAYAMQYAVLYLTYNAFEEEAKGNKQAEDKGQLQVGRLVLLLYSLNWLSSHDIYDMSFGIGHGAITASEWLHENKADIMYRVMGVRGPPSGFLLALIETGIVGAGLLSAFMIYAFWKLRREYRGLRSEMARRWFRMLTIIFLVFFFDFFFYSIALLRQLPMPFIFSGALASILVVKHYDKFLILHQSSGLLTMKEGTETKNSKH